MPVRIGIPPCLDGAERIRAGRRTHYLDVRYADAICEAGGLPLYLPAPAPPAELVEGLDGLLIPGGDDFPSPDPLPEGARLEPAAPEQIDFDTALIQAALRRGLPVLGVCYGMQLLALAHGGSLIHDLPTQAVGSAEHRLPESARHGVRIAPGSRLESILGSDPGGVNSLHHQAVRDAGRLAVVAHSEDGTIEAIERPARDDGADDGFVIGVQWHPEKMPGAHRTALFRALVEAAGSRSRR